MARSLVDFGDGLVTIRRVETAIAYQSRRRALILVDCFALALARHRGHPLLTEGRRIRACVLDESILYHDVLWLVDQMHDAVVLATPQVIVALEEMLADPRCPVPKPELSGRIRNLIG